MRYKDTIFPLKKQIIRLLILYLPQIISTSYSKLFNAKGKHVERRSSLLFLLKS